MCVNVHLTALRPASRRGHSGCLLLGVWNDTQQFRQACRQHQCNLTPVFTWWCVLLLLLGTMLCTSSTLFPESAPMQTYTSFHLYCLPLVPLSAGGAWNHALYFKHLAPATSPNADPTKSISKDLSAAIDSSFGSLAKMQEEVTTAATKVFGSGWAWVCYTGVCWVLGGGWQAQKGGLS